MTEKEDAIFFLPKTPEKIIKYFFMQTI